MNRHLGAVGFKNMVTPIQYRKLNVDAVSNPSQRYFFPLGGGKDYIEYYKEYGSKFGIAIKGTIDDDDQVKIDQVTPYAQPPHPTEVTHVAIEQVEGSDDHYVYCIHAGGGNDLVFFLQNVYEYKKTVNMNHRNISEVYIAALSDFGKVILPIDTPDKVQGTDGDLAGNRMKIFNNSKRDEFSFSAVFDEEIEGMSGSLWDKIKEFDLLSVVDAYIIPHAEEVAMYSVLGQITAVTTAHNTYSNEEIKVLTVDVTGTNFDVLINTNDLVGFPTVGMRFMGVCWLQGFI